MITFAVALLLFVPTFDARSHSSREMSYVRCEDDSSKKLVNFSYPGKELICDNINNMDENYILERKVWNRKDKKLVIQFVSVEGSLQKDLTEYYPGVLNILIYKSKIIDFGMCFQPGSQLVVVESIFPTVTRRIFKEATQLQHLGFHSNPGLIFDDNCFLELKHLRSLTFYNQLIPELKSSSLAGTIKLRKLVIIDSGLTNIAPDAFLHNRRLTELILDYNPIEHINANITSLTHLRKLSLLNTHIKKFNLPLFNYMSSFTSLGLPNEAWSNIKVVELAIAFPNLEVTIFNKNEEEGEYIKQLIEDMKSAGLRVDIVERSKKLESSIYAEELEIVY